MIPCQCQIAGNQGQPRHFAAKGSPHIGRPRPLHCGIYTIRARNTRTIREKSERIRSGKHTQYRPGRAFHDYPPPRGDRLSHRAFPSLLPLSSHPFIFTHSPFPCTLSCLPASCVCSWPLSILLLDNASMRARNRTCVYKIH